MVKKFQLFTLRLGYATCTHQHLVNVWKLQRGTLQAFGGVNWVFIKFLWANKTGGNYKNCFAHCCSVFQLVDRCLYSTSDPFNIVSISILKTNHGKWTVVLPGRRSWGKMSARGGKKKSTKLSRSARAGVIFPVGRMMRYLRTGTHKYRIGMGAPVYMAAVIEYLAGCCLTWVKIHTHTHIFLQFSCVSKIYTE